MRRALLVVLLASVVGACAHAAEANPLGAAPVCARSDGGHELLECLAPSVAFVETPLATGSAVLVEGGYLVTNAHVVDPFDYVTIRFQDGGSLNVDVVGVDLFADIAVLGPVRVDRPELALESGLDLEKGDDVWLLGYPGGLDLTPEVAVSDGVLSRVRRSEEFDLTYLQTDAAIGGGQSGGALVDGNGRLIGISGLSFADEFALALDGGDVAGAVQRIIDGDGSAYAPMPYGIGTGTKRSTVELADYADTGLLLIRALYEDTTLRLELTRPEGIAVEVATVDGEPLFVNDVAIASYDELGVPTEMLGSITSPPVAPGVWEVELPAGIEVVVSLNTVAAPTAATDVVTSVEAQLLPPVERHPIAPGDKVTGSIDFLELHDVYELDLSAGDRVRLVVRSPLGDMLAEVLAPGQRPPDATQFDDDGGGLFGTDADGEFTAEVSGIHHVVVSQYDVLATGYTIEVMAG